MEERTFENIVEKLAVIDGDVYNGAEYQIFHNVYVNLRGEVAEGVDQMWLNPFYSILSNINGEN